MATQTIKFGVGGVVALLIGGAIYLSIERGPAILLDLAASGAAFLCL